MNRDQRSLTFVENNMADVAAAEMALGRLWLRLRGWCRRPAVSLDDIDVVGQELREIEMGLAAARRGLQVQRADLTAITGCDEIRHNSCTG